MKHRIVITQHRPRLKAALIAGFVFVIALAAWGLYAYTRATTVTDFAKARSEVEQLRDERRQLSRDLRAAHAEIDQLKEQAVYVERSQDIDTQACSSVRDSLGTLQTEVSDLREQLAFYRGIVSPDQSRAGVRIYDFKLHPAAGGDVFRYDLVLIQSVRHDQRVAGAVQMQIHGTTAGAAQTLNLTDVAVGGVQNLVFSFKYFEEFGGEFRLPAGFKPSRVTVSLEPAVEGAPRIDDEFEWKKLISAGGGK
ncbi:MAG TPA: DUF6776 family protein [Solimonas sp.]|nr:DUF6776 family protein [Solimonas sp.]